MLQIHLNRNVCENIFHGLNRILVITGLKMKFIQDFVTRDLKKELDYNHTEIFEQS